MERGTDPARFIRSADAAMNGRSLPRYDEWLFEPYDEDDLSSDAYAEAMRDKLEAEADSRDNQP